MGARVAGAIGCLVGGHEDYEPIGAGGYPACNTGDEADPRMCTGLNEAVRSPVLRLTVETCTVRLATDERRTR